MLQLSWNFKNVIPYPSSLPSSDQCIFSKILLTVDSDHKRPTTGQGVNIRLQTAQPETEHVSALSKGSWWKRGQKECKSQRQWVTTVKQYLLVRATAVLMNSLPAVVTAAQDLCKPEPNQIPKRICWPRKGELTKHPAPSYRSSNNC